jgi:3-oxoacyl-[acyl-carrier-protein] synthase III
LAFIKSKVPSQIDKSLHRNSLSKQDIQNLIFRQASKLALDNLQKSLKIESSMLFRNAQDFGNIAFESIPRSLRQEFDQGVFGNYGAVSMISSFGVELSWACGLGHKF